MHDPADWSRHLRSAGPITFARVTGVNQWRATGRAAALAMALCLTASVRPASGQVGAAVGAQVGYSRADLTGENADLAEARQGAITGVYLHVPLHRMASVRPEVLFSVKGGSILSGNADSDDLVLVDLELAYLELPLLGRLTLPRGRFRPAVFGGPAIGIQIGCDLLFTTPDTTVNGTCGEDVTGVSEWDYGWVAGAAIEMHLPRTTLAIQGRYSAGLRSVVEGPVELKNRGMAVLFGLTF